MSVWEFSRECKGYLHRRYECDRCGMTVNVEVCVEGGERVVRCLECGGILE